jgi:hypothetical protein
VWRTPEAAAWSPGAASVVARRAALEDALAEGRLDEDKAFRAMLDLDRELGLTPKASAQLRWQVVPGAEDAPADPSQVASLAARRARLTGAS